MTQCQWIQTEHNIDGEAVYIISPQWPTQGKQLSGDWTECLYFREFQLKPDKDNYLIQ